MQWTVRECSRTPLDGFDLSWLPKGLPPGIAAFSQGSAFGLEIDSLVGSIPLTNGDTLQILPKVKGLQFMRMLLEADIATEGSLWNSDDLVDYDLTEDLSLASLVSKPFVAVLKELQAGSALFAWERVRTRSEFVDGEIDIASSVIALAQSESAPFHVRTRNRRYDTPENRVISAAASVCSDRFGYLLSKAERVFLDVFVGNLGASVLRPDDLPHVADGLASERYEGTRGYYTAALRLAQIILGEYGINQGEARIQAQPVLFNSAAVFERFIRAHLQKAYQARGLTVRKGFFPERFLYTDGTTLLDPDVVVLRNDQVRLIADAKYKVQTVTSSDHYQVHAYAMRVGVSCAVFFCAAEESTTTKVVTRSSHLGLSVHEVQLPLADLNATVNSLRTLERHVPAFRPY